MFREGQKFVLKKCEEDGVLPDGALLTEYIGGHTKYNVCHFVYKNAFDFSAPMSIEKGELIFCEVKDEK